MDFNQAFDRLIGNEGGYVNNPADPGGETNWGISKRAYPAIDIKNLTRDGAKAIYLRDFWLRGNMDNLPPALAFQAFDAAVNHGIERAVLLIQAAVGAAQDGNIGPKTMAAITSKTPADLVVLFVAARIDFWTSLSTWADFGKGWARRAATDLRYAAQDL